MPECMRKTLDGRPFLAVDAKLYDDADNGAENDKDVRDERFWIFLAPWGKAMLDKSPDWFIDGTFEICGK